MNGSGLKIIKDTTIAKRISRLGKDHFVDGFFLEELSELHRAS